MKRIFVYTAVTNSDLEEGRGREVILGRFTHFASARAAAKGEGVWGTDGGVKEEEIVVFDSLEEYKQFDRTEGRDRYQYEEYLRLKELYGDE